jgi:cytidylate kinase
MSWLCEASIVTGSVVTISAPYGAGGPVIGRAVAQQLDVPFLDRAIPTAVARRLAVSLTDAEAHDERADTRMTRVLSALGVAGLGFVPTLEPRIPPEVYRDQTERLILDTANASGCVVLGRAAVVVLRDVPRALHVCLTGPLERRVAQAIAYDAEGDARTVKRLVVETDRNRKAYYRFFYNADPDDLSLYQLVLDSTALSFDVCVQLITTAARAMQLEPGTVDG